jgi:hypothetical protein
VVADVQGSYEFAVHEATLAIASESGLSLGPAAGGARHDVVTGVPIRGLAIEDGTVYFARDDACHPGTGVGNGQPFCKGKFFSVPISGGTVRELFASEGQPTELFADSACLYWVQIVGQCHPGRSVSMGVAPR